MTALHEAVQRYLPGRAKESGARGLGYTWVTGHTQYAAWQAARISPLMLSHPGDERLWATRTITDMTGIL